MFVRPTRQATALCPNDARRAIVHRNELNEQQRPGDLVLFAQNFLETRGNKAVTRWIPKLIRRLTLEGDGADASAILADGLLFYTGAYIRQNSLDKFSLIPEALLCKDVLFITNHIDVSPLLALAGHISDVRSGTDLGTGLYDDADDNADEQDETFKFGGYIEFNFKGKKGKERAAYVKEFKQCLASNVDDINMLLPDELWGSHVCIDNLKLMPACPWGPPVAESLPMIHVMIIDSGDYAGDPIRGFFDYSSGFGEGCAYELNGGPKLLGIPRAVEGDEVIMLPLFRRGDLSSIPDAASILTIPREFRPWLRHQHEVVLNLSQFPRVPKSAVLHPIYICAPGGVPFQLNKTPSELTFVAELALISGSTGDGHPPSAPRLAALHPPSLSARMRGVAQWLAPPRARTLKLAQQAIRRNVFEKIKLMKDDTRVSVFKLEIKQFGQEKAAALDVWKVLDISNMDNAELSYPFEDGVDSIADTISFKGGMHPKEYGFFIFEHHKHNEISYSPVHDTLRLVLRVRWYDNKGDWRAGVPETPDDASLQYSLVKDKWVTEDELNQETLGDRKRKFGAFIDTLYK